MRRSLTLRVLQVLAGLGLYGVGIAFMVQGALGVASWDVLAQGISRTSGLEFGVVMFLVSLAVFLLWIPLRQRPGPGTVLNIVIVPIVSQLTIDALPQPDELWLRILYLAAGILIIGIATGIYLGAAFGPGPRDGLMTGLHRVTGWPIWLVRTLLEVTVVVIGWLLGGDAAIGTLAFALLIGPIVHVAMPWFRPRERAAEPKPAAIDDPEDAGEGPPEPAGLPG